MTRYCKVFFVLASLLVLAAPLGAQPAAYQGHGAESVSRETLQKYAPPPLSPAVSARIQMALDTRAPGLGRLTPDGKRLVFGWSITGVPQIWRLDAPQGFPVQMTGGEDRTGLADITPDGKLLVVSRDRGGQENPGLYLQPIEGGALREIQHLPKVQTFFEFVSDDGRYVYFRANDREATSYAIYRYEIASGKRDLVFGESGLWSISDQRQEGGVQRLLLSKATGALSAEIFEWTSAEGRLTPLFGQGEKEEYDVAYGAKGEVLARSNKLGEFRRLYRFSAKDGFVPVTPEAEMDVAGFGLDRARRRLYVQWNDGGFLRLEARDAASYAKLALPEFPGAESVFAGSATPDGRYAIVGVASSKEPTASYVYDWQTGKLTRWTLPSAPEVDLTTYAVSRLESYPAADGTPIPMLVRYPKGCEPEAPRATPCPVVVEFHGGPEGQSTPGFSPRIQLFIDAGFVFAQPNVRGSDGYGKSWLAADNGAKRLQVLSDIDQAGKVLRQKLTRGGVAPKVGIAGGSYGGYATLIGMTKYAGTYDAGVSIVGISDLRTFLANTAPYRRILRASEYGDLEKDAAALAELSPVTYLERVKAPLLLIQGVDDPRVPAGEAIQIQEKLAARGVASQLILLEGEGHGAARRQSQVTQLGHTLRFFEEHLKSAAVN